MYRFLLHVVFFLATSFRLVNDPEPCQYKNPEKLFIVSDIEGEFDVFRQLLKANNIIDQQNNWIFGRGHLVICGDLFDRGKQVEELLLLLHNLEPKAEETGGYLHVILGNHDIMNMSGDYRYVNKKYLDNTGKPTTAYLAIFSKTSMLGKWLRSKNIVERIGDNLFLHAGIAPAINSLKMPLENINNICRAWYDRVYDNALLTDTTASKFFMPNTSPFWYRGYFTKHKADESVVDETQALYGVKRIVVGHTIVPGNIALYYGGKVLGVDVNRHAGVNQAVLVEKGKWWKVDDKGLHTPLE